jgi:hypothetical protein
MGEVRLDGEKSERMACGPISKIRPSDGCGRDAVLLAVVRWYESPEFGSYLGNVGYYVPLSEG